MKFIKATWVINAVQNISSNYAIFRVLHVKETTLFIVEAQARETILEIETTEIIGQLKQ